MEITYKDTVTVTLITEEPSYEIDINYDYFLNLIKNIPTIEYESDGTGYGCIVDGVNESGIYIKLEDVLALFSAKKE
jgi:hypothetical protein